MLYCGVMFGVSGAVSGVRVLSTQISKTALKKIPQKALTKTFWYPILKKIAKTVGVTITKKTVAQGVSKVVPLIGGVISGSINFASMMPMANRLKDALDKAAFNYSEEEFNKDIEIIMNPDDYEEKVEDESFSKKISDGIKNTNEGISKFITKMGKNNQTDKYEELKKLKELLDDNIITQEEFEQKKKEILN